MKKSLGATKISLDGRMLGIQWTERLSNTNDFRKMETKWTLTLCIRKRQLKFLRHITILIRNMNVKSD